MEKPRLRGHALTWLGVTRCLCQCGTAFHLEPEECRNRRSSNLRDELMDRHSNHIKLLRYAREIAARKKRQERRDE